MASKSTDMLTSALTKTIYDSSENNENSRNLTKNDTRRSNTTCSSTGTRLNEENKCIRSNFFLQAEPNVVLNNELYEQNEQKQIIKM